METLLPLAGIVFLIALGVVLLYQQFQKSLYKQQLEKEAIKSQHQQALLATTIKVQEDERKRIAQDLHDELAATLSLSALTTQAEEYTIDTQGAHAFIQFKIQHLGYSWLLGRFNTFGGEFSYDESNPSAATIRVDIDPASIFE